MKVYEMLIYFLEFLKVALLFTVLTLMGWGFVDWKFPGAGIVGALAGCGAAIGVAVWWYKIFDKKVEQK